MTAQTLYTTRKRLEIAFRRWLTGKAPSVEFASLLYSPLSIYRETIAQRFAQEMTWENFGAVWQLDHIVPLSFFDLTNPVQIALAWSLDNLYPMTCAENKTKGACLESSYLTLIQSAPFDIETHARLVNFVKPYFIQKYPRLIVKLST